MDVTKLTVPDTVAPLAGDAIVTEGAGVAVEVGVADCAKERVPAVAKSIRTASTGTSASGLKF